MGYVLWQAVGPINHLAICDDIDRLIVAEIAVVFVLDSLPCCAHAVDRLILHPIDCIPLREPSVSVVDDNGDDVLRPDGYSRSRRRSIGRATAV